MLQRPQRESKHGGLKIERTVIERRNLVIYIGLACAAFLFALAAVILLFVELTAYYIVNLFFLVTGGIIMLIISGTLGRKKNKEMMVLDDDGLMINGDVSLGPIPWDCVLGAEIKRIAFDKHLAVYITDITKMEMIFGEDTVRKKVGKGKDGERLILINIDSYKLKGTDVAALIRERAAGNASTRSADQYPQPGTKMTRWSKMETNKKILLLAIITSIPLGILGFWLGYTSV